MDILGIGPLELFFVLLIALIIFGPNDIVRAGKTVGSFLRNIVKSDGWKAFNQARKGMKDLPTTLMREAGLEEEELRQMTGLNDLEEATKDFEHQISPWTTPPSENERQPANESEGTPSADPGSDEPIEPEKPEGPPPGSPFSQTIDSK